MKFCAATTDSQRGREIPTRVDDGILGMMRSPERNAKQNWRRFGGLTKAEAEDMDRRTRLNPSSLQPL